MVCLSPITSQNLFNHLLELFSIFPPSASHQIYGRISRWPISSFRFLNFLSFPKTNFLPWCSSGTVRAWGRRDFILSWIFEENTVDTLREIQLKHSGKYSWYRGRSDCILRWDLCGSGQARISCITDRCSQRYALVNLGLQLYLAWSLFVCPPHLLVGLLLPRLRNTRYKKTRPSGHLAPKLVYV